MTVISLENYIKELKKLRRSIPEWALLVSEQIAQSDAAALIADRVQSTGKDESGNAFSEYSPSYKKFKQKRATEGTTVFKDFTLTSEMWRSFGVIKKTKTNKEIKIKLGGRNRDGQIKMNVNSKREGVSIIGISKKEEDLVLEAFDKELFKLLQRTL